MANPNLSPAAFVCVRECGHGHACLPKRVDSCLLRLLLLLLQSPSQSLLHKQQGPRQRFMYAPRRRRRLRRCGDPLRCLFYYTLRELQIHLGYARVEKE